MRLDLEDLEAKLSARTGAIYVIHYAGFPQATDGWPRWRAGPACR